MEQKRRKPVAVCPKCGEHTGHTQHIARRCYRRIEGARCRGIFRAALDPDDWEACPSCAAAGWIDEQKCHQCAGHGWLSAAHS